MPLRKAVRALTGDANIQRSTNPSFLIDHAPWVTEKMAEPVSLASGLLTLATLAIQSYTALVNAVPSY